MSGDPESDDEGPTTEDNSAASLAGPNVINYEVGFWTSELDLLGQQRLLFQQIVRLADGQLVPDSKSPIGFLVSPSGTTLDSVADAGGKLSNTYKGFGPLGYLAQIDPILMTRIGINVGTGGIFDYQREFNSLIGFLESGHIFTQHREYRDISNVNVGLFMQRAGFTLDETLGISGHFASYFSSNARSSELYHLDLQTRAFIEIGWRIGASGASARPLTRIP